MKTAMTLLIIYSAIVGWAIDATASFGEIKEEIAICERKLASPLQDHEKSQLHYALAVAYFHDQEIDQSFQHFLKSLKYIDKKNDIPMEQKERELYEEALDFYLTQGGTDPVHAAKEMVKNYSEIANENPNFVHLNFLIATAYANLGNYDLFFENFFKGYPYLYDSFLAYKTQGILFLRLSQHARLKEERHLFQEEAFHFLTLALDRNPNDASLYKVLIFLAKDERNDSQIQTYLQKMVEHQIYIPRGDIYLYVREAVALGEYVLGQQIIDKARALYEYSRAISAAQDYLDQHKG